jgi:hypothetical protein
LLEGDLQAQRHHAAEGHLLIDVRRHGIGNAHLRLAGIAMW